MSQPQPTGLSSDLKNKFYDVRTELQRFWFVRGGLQFVLCSLVAFAGLGLIDFFVPLHMAIRVTLVLGLLVFAFVGLVRALKYQENINDLTAAMELENANPHLGQRLRTAQQFESHRTDPAPALTSALIAETNLLAAKAALESPIRWRALNPWLAGIGTLAVSLLAVLSLVDETRVTLARMLLVPIHYSNLAVAESEPIVAGSDATVSAIATGRPLDKVELWVRGKHATEWEKISMLPNGVAPEADVKERLKLKGELTATIEQCEGDLVYKIVASPLPASKGKLIVLQPLKQQSFAVTIDPPAYTQAEKKTISEMEISVVEGTMVAWQLELNRAPATAKLVSLNSKDDSPLPAIEIQGNKLVCDLAQLAASKNYEVQAEAADGMKFNSDRIRIRVKKDRGPAVAFRKPQDELEVTATTEVGVSLRITDDFGLGKVGVEYQINGGERRTLWEDDLSGSQTEFVTMPVLYLEQHNLTHEDAITYYAYAEDNRAEPKRTRSELQFIDIRPYKREYQVVDSNCQGGGNCLSLEELIKRQRHNLRRTFANLDRQPIQDSLSQRLARTQREIQTATEEFTTGWERKFGPMPTLHLAVATMDRAAEELERKALDPAMPLEESALVDLIRAKQNARKFLKNCKSAGQFSQCKNYDTAMAQKIRQPERKDDGAAESVARAREQVQELAEQQKRFSEEVAAANGGAKLEKKPNSLPKSGSRSGSNPSGQGQPNPQSQHLAKAQESAAQQAEQMRKTMERNDVASELAQQTMNEAADKIEQSAETMGQGDELAAAEQARKAAELLEQLDEHLQGLSEPDLAKRLAIAEQIASRLATAESQVSESLEDQMASAASPQEDVSDLAETQIRLARQAETLADLLRHLEADALGDNIELRQGLDEIQSEHQPEELARDMQQVAQQIGNRNAAAVRGAQHAAKGLGNIASALGALRRAALQPQLDQLMAAEANTSALIQSITAARSPAELTQQYEELQDQLANLNVPTKEATSSMLAQPGSGAGAGAASSSGTGAAGPEFFYAGRSRNVELRQVLSVLQARIQDAILLTARMDADEPVPAKYRELVSEYYQALSDDLR